MTNAQFESLKKDILSVFEKYSVDAAFLVVASGDDVFGGTIRSDKVTPATVLLDALEQANFSTLNNGSLPSGYKTRGGVK